MQRAFRKLDKIRKNTVWWEAAAQPGALMAAGVVSMSSAYTLWFDPADERNRHTRIVWRQSLYDIDSWAIPRARPSWMRRIASSLSQVAAERQKVLSERMAYGPTNRNAVQLLPPARRHAAFIHRLAGAAHQHRILDRAWRCAGTALQFLGPGHLSAAGRRRR